MNTNISSKISTITSDNKVLTVVPERAAKRAASGQHESPVKRTKVDHHSYEKNIPNVASKPNEQFKFAITTDTAASARTNVQLMPEISDNELLEMAIQFELEHPQ